MSRSDAEFAAGGSDGNGTGRGSIHERVLLLLPLGRDGELARHELERADLEPIECGDLRRLVARLREGAGVALLAEEVLGRGTAELFEVFDAQETWSDLPVIVLLRQDGPLPESVVPLRAFERHPKIKTTFLQRPVPALSLVSSVRAGLKSRRRQYQVRDLLARLSDDVRLRDEFLAMLSHELRNPVSSIGYVSELFEMAGPSLTSEKASWGAAVIGRQVRHLGRLLDQLLDVARVQSGKIELELETLDLRGIAEQCAESMRAGGGRREWSLRLPEQPVLVRGDGVRLSQIVNNLLENAVKYTAPGGRIGVEVDIDLDERSALLAVVDDGRGIEESALGHVFEPFYQEGGVRAGRSAGLGLGLAMVDKLVRLHGGTIGAFSRGPGRGSRFVLRLPRLEETAGAERPIRTREPTGSPSLRLLIVEDNVEVARLFALLLSSLGHEAHVEHDGVAGVEAARRLAPDLVFIDIGLPDIDGAEAARRIRAALGREAPRLVAVTGFSQSRQQDGSEFDDYLLKPVSRRQVEELFASL